MKYYVVWQGRETGIFTDWNTCNKHVKGFAGARYKSFKTRDEAEAAFKGVASAGAVKSAATPKRPSAAAKVKTYSAAEVAALEVDVKIFTDGGCDPNPGKAGSGIAVYRQGVVSELWYGLFNPAGTNNTAELNALHQAMLMAKECVAKSESVAIFCDSKYSIQCITTWAAGWKKNGWKKKTGEIKNLDLIQKMFALYQDIKEKVQILHVNGHVGVEGNELADRMSIVAIETKETDFVLYRDSLDVAAILAMRAG